MSKRTDKGGITLRATWPNQGRSCTYWVPADRIEEAYALFPVTGEYRVDLESMGFNFRRPKGIDHHIDD